MKSIPGIDDFTKEIWALKNDARLAGESHIDINAGTLHRIMGDPKGKDARMHSCCRAMYACMNLKDEVIQLPYPRRSNDEPKGFGSRLTIRYYI